MTLKVVLPHRMFATISNVKRIVVDSKIGSVGLLPHRLDCVLPLVPGVLLYESVGMSDRFIGINGGLLVKIAQEVVVTTSRAAAGGDVDHLAATAEVELLKDLAAEERMRERFVALEGALMRRLRELRGLRAESGGHYG